MPNVFISHAGVEDEVSRRVKDDLSDADFRSVFLDIDPERGIVPGAEWESNLYHHVETADAVILLLSPRWLGSNWCFAEYALSRMLGKAIIPAQIEQIDPASVAANLQHVRLYEDFDVGMDRIVAQLRRVSLDASGGFELPPHRPPYPGLMPFEARDAAVYFGRQPEIAELWESLRSVASRPGLRAIALSGASGTGKSSLLKAGLLPRLDFEPDRWKVLPPVRLGDDPFGRLSSALARTLGGDAADIGKRLRAAPSDAAEWLASRLEASHGAVPVISLDQVEELFTEAGRIERAQFLQFVQALARTLDGPVVIAVIRSEYLASLQETPGFGSVTTVWVPDLTSDRIPEMIRGPARVAGVKVEDALVTRATEDAGRPGSLPLLAFALRELYDHSGADGILTLDEYLALAGGRDETPITSALKRVADRVVDVRALSPADLAILRSLFVPALVRVDEAGNFVRRVAELSEIPETARPFLRDLSTARLIRTFRDEGRECVEVAHDALFRHWDILAKWLSEDREYLVVKAQVERDAAALDDPDLEREEDAYLTGFRLARAEDLVAHQPGMLSERDRDFVVRSAAAKARRDRNRRRLAGYAFGLSVAAAAGFAVFSSVLKVQLDTNERQANVVKSQLLALQAERASETDIYAALEFGLRAAETVDSFESRSVLVQASLNIPLEVVSREVLAADATPNGLVSGLEGDIFHYASAEGEIRRVNRTGAATLLDQPVAVSSEDRSEIIALDQTRGGQAAWVSLSGEIGLAGLGQVATGAYVDAAALDVESGTFALALEGSQEVSVWRCGPPVDLGEVARCLEDDPTETLELPDPNEAIRRIALSASGFNLAVAGWDSLYIWRGTRTPNLQPDVEAWRKGALAWSPGSDALAVAETDGLRVHDRAGETVTLFTENVSFPTWSRDGDRLAAVCGEDGLGLCVWTYRNGTFEHVLEAYGHSESIRGVLWRDGDPVTLDQAGNLVTSRLAGARQSLANAFERNTNGQAFGLAVHPGGDGLAVASGPSVIWVRGDGTVTRFESAPTMEFRTVAWGAGGDWIGATTMTGHIIVWRPENTDPVRALRISTKQVERIGWSRELRSFVTGEAAGRLVITPPASGDPLYSGPLSGEVLGIGTSPATGSIVAVTDHGEVVRFAATSLAEPDLRYNASAEKGVVGADGISRDAVSFHPNGRIFAVAGNAADVPLFHVDQADPIAQLRTEAFQVQDVGFSDDGTKIATLDTTRTLRVWEVEAGQSQDAIAIEPLFAVDLGLARRHVPGFLTTPTAPESTDWVGASITVSGHPERLAWRGDDILLSTTNGRLLTINTDPDETQRAAARILRRGDALVARHSETR